MKSRTSKLDQHRKEWTSKLEMIEDEEYTGPAQARCKCCGRLL
jgi:hypothetical protein